ncbi:MAG TPA: hypothetical protein VNG53_02645, partial [Bacteroidia bacterium]|nr:hypothetical protein [Bacteroidia bacterium]
MKIVVIKKANFYIILLIINFVFVFSQSKAQSQDTIKQVDIYDVFRHIFKIKSVNSRIDTAKIPPGKLLFVFAPTVEYTLEAGAQASLAMNISFYTGNQSNTNLSVINTGAQYSIHNQLMAPIISNIWSKGNKIDWLGDWRYYKYPSYTYGLGSNSSLSKADFVDYSYVKFYEEMLRHFKSKYYAGFGYYLDYHYNIIDKTLLTDYSDYSKNATSSISSGLVAHFMYDSRINVNNPQNAFYASVLYRYNSTLLGSENNWQGLQLEARKYFKLSANKILAFWSWNEFTFDGKAPYFDLPSNGWDTNSNTGRG